MSFRGMSPKRLQLADRICIDYNATQRQGEETVTSISAGHFIIQICPISCVENVADRAAIRTMKLTRSVRSTY